MGALRKLGRLKALQEKMRTSTITLAADLGIPKGDLFLLTALGAIDSCARSHERGMWMQEEFNETRFVRDARQARAYLFSAIEVPGFM